MQLLNQLTQICGVPGREKNVREFILSYLKEKQLVDEHRVDAMGNLITLRKARKTSDKKSVNVMLAAHMDQIGFLVSFISKDGSLKIDPVGGFDTRNLFARRVKVHTSNGKVLAGIMNPAGRPVHLASPEERKKIPTTNEFFIDLALDHKEVIKDVKIGDMITLDGSFEELGEAVTARALDNRVGCWALIKMLENIGNNHSCNIHAVWTVQEEVGLRGAGPAAYGVNPDIAISCDTTLCCDTPGVSQDSRVTEFGAGVCIKIKDGSTITDIDLVQDIEKIACENNITCQRGLMARGGQDGAMLQRSREGVRTAVFACPVKYIHTTSEMAHKTDLEAYHKLLVAYLNSL